MLNFQGNEHITKPKYKTGEKIKLEFSIINPHYKIIQYKLNFMIIKLWILILKQKKKKKMN